MFTKTGEMAEPGQELRISSKCMDNKGKEYHSRQLRLKSFMVIIKCILRAFQVNIIPHSCIKANRDV